MTTKISGTVERENAFKFQQAVKVGDGRFHYFRENSNGSWSYEVSFIESSGYVDFYEYYDRVTTPIIETRRVLPSWKRVVAKLNPLNYS